MCRWLAYSGAPRFLEELIFRPEHSLIDMSLQAHSSHSTTNGDGFGVGWFGAREKPGTYKNVRPAWNDANLRNLAAQIESPLFLAHVRATTGTAIQHTNCHPFQHGRWLFCHNGLIESFDRVRRKLMCAVAPELFNSVSGTTDTEVLFYLALTFGLEEHPLEALQRTVGFVERVGHAAGVAHPVQMTLGVTDGEQLIVVRHSSRHRSPTLFRSLNVDALCELCPSLRSQVTATHIVVSEPLTSMTDNWVEIGESKAVVIAGGRVQERDFTPADDEAG